MKDIKLMNITHHTPRRLSTLGSSLCLCASVLALSVFAPQALAQDLAPKAPPQSIKTTIINATIHTVSGPTIPVGSLTFDNGIITAITPGPAEAIATADQRIIDAKGQHLYPSLIAASTQLGLAEFGAVRATLDINETGDITPEARAVSSINPDSTLLPVTRTNGILIAAVIPEGGRIPGQVAVVKLDGWTWEQMAITQNAGIAIEWPQMRPITAWWMDRSEEDQLKDIKSATDTIDNAFTSAAAYRDAKAKDPATPIDLRYEALMTVLPPASGSATSQLPVFISATDLDQITAAVTWAVSKQLRPVIVGGRDAHLCTDLLKANDVPVIITGTHTFPKRADSPYDDAFTLPKRLADAGVRFCIASADRTAHERNLAYNASTAVAFGLDKDTALKSLTLYPAQILGIAPTPARAPKPNTPAYGSLEVGHSATLFLAPGDILEVTTSPTQAWISGREIDLRNKQSHLADKYREKYRQLKEAR